MPKKTTAPKRGRAPRGARARTLPPLPAVVHSALGPIRVELVSELTKEVEDAPKDTAVCGLFRWREREILIEREMTRESQWYTLFHEITHAALCDSGAGNALDHDRTELICDAVAAHWTGTLRAGGTLPARCLTRRPRRTRS